MNDFTIGPVRGYRPSTPAAVKVRTPVLEAPDEADPNWRDYAACLDVDPEIFYPVSESEAGFARVQIEEAKAVCRRCDSLADCLSWALETDQQFGVWGGMSSQERKNFKRRSNRAARSGAVS